MKQKFFALIFLAALLSPTGVSAKWLFPDFSPNGEVKGDVAVAATVPSPVCAQYSSATSNVASILADDSQKAIFTVKVKDCNEVVMDNVEVRISSNRGEIDHLEAIDSDGKALPLLRGEVIAVTDETGLAYFQTYSKVPGQAVFSFMADSSVNLPQVRLTFLTLPFPKNITIVVEVPTVLIPEGKIILFSPPKESVPEENLVNLGVELKVPFLLFAIIAFLVILAPVLFVIILILIGRVRKFQKKENVIIEQEAAAISKEEQLLEKIVGKEEPPTINNNIKNWPTQ